MLIMKLIGVICHLPRFEGSSMAFPSLSELIIENCNKEILGSTVGLSFLITPRTRSMPELMHLEGGDCTDSNTCF